MAVWVVSRKHSMVRYKYNSSLFFSNQCCSFFSYFRLELQRVRVVEAEASQVPQSQTRSQSTAKISSEKSEQTEGERDSQIDSGAGFFVSETAPLWTAASQSTEITNTKKR